MYNPALQTQRSRFALNFLQSALIYNQLRRIFRFCRSTLQVNHALITRYGRAIKIAFSYDNSRRSSKRFARTSFCPPDICGRGSSVGARLRENFFDTDSVDRRRHTYTHTHTRTQKKKHTHTHIDSPRADHTIGRAFSTQLRVVVRLAAVGGEDIALCVCLVALLLKAVVI